MSFRETRFKLHPPPSLELGLKSIFDIIRSTKIIISWYNSTSWQGPNFYLEYLATKKMGSRSTAHISVTRVECFPKIKTSQILFLLFVLFLPLIFRRLLCQPLLLPPIQLVAIFLFNTKWIFSLYSLSSGRSGYNLKAV